MIKTHTLRTSLAALALLTVASCNVQESAPSTEPTSVILAPRFAAGASVHATDSVTVVLQTASSVHDTTVRYAYKGVISLGTLPPGVQFSVTMTGYSYDGSGSKVATWWTSARDSSGSNATRTVTLDTLRQCVAPQDSFGLIDTASYDIRGTDTVFFQGKRLRFPAGTLITKDGGDPRFDKSAINVGVGDSGFMTDSVTKVIRAVVKMDGDLQTGRPALWSPVKEFKLELDPLDTMTSLDSLNLSTIMALSTSNSINMPFFHKESLVVLATINNVDLRDTFQITLHLRVTPSSPRAIVRLGDAIIPSNTPTRILFPADSTLEVTVGNHGRVSIYQVRFQKQIKTPSSMILRFDSVATNPPGIVHDTTNKKMTILVPSGQNTLVFRPYPDSGQVVVIQGDTLSAGDSTVLALSPDTSTIKFSLQTTESIDPQEQRYTLRINRPALDQDFLDTTYGVPWRKVAYDTLVDARNSIKYRTVVVGKARWMAENLRYKRDTTFCPGNNLENCTKYGRLYRWYSAADTTVEFDYKALTIPAGPFKGVCPTGWHLPSRDEWQNLLTTLGTDSASNLLRSTGDSWTLGGGQDAVGLRILPAGRRFVDFDTPRDNGDPHYHYELMGTDTWFWTSTQGSLDAKDAVALHITQTSTVAAFEENTRKSGGLSVRCVSDTAVVAP